MADRDAFGNEKNEDPLAGLSDATNVSVGGGFPEPPSSIFGSDTGAPKSPFDLPPPATATPYTATDVMAIGKVVGFVFKVGLPLLIFGAVGYSIFSIGNDVSNDVRKAFGTAFTIPTTPASTGEAPGSPSPLPSSTPSTPSTPPVGLGKGSLLKAANFTAAVRRLQTEGARARSVRVAADRIDASIVTTTGRAKQVQVTSAGDMQVFGPATLGASLSGTFVLADLVRSAPSRLARQAASRAGKQPSSVDYMVALQLGAENQAWTVVLKNGGGQFLADRTGRITRKIN